MNVIKLNGIVIENAVFGKENTLNIKDGEIIINGVVQKTDDKVINITINGDSTIVNADNCDSIVVNGNVSVVSTINGDVKVEGNVQNVSTINGDVYRK